MWELINNPSDHPLANIKSARELLDSLPKEDTAKLLQEIAYWVESVTVPENKFRLSHQLAVLRLLDDTAHPYLSNAVNEYFAVPAPSAFRSNSMWVTLNEYYSRVGHAYLSVLRSCLEAKKRSSAITLHLPLVTARGIYALAGKLKLAAARYAVVEPEVWSDMSEFYAFAEAKKYLNEPLTLYDEFTAGKSIQALFAGTLIWQACCSGSLSPLQIHIAERVITSLGNHLTLDAQYFSGSMLAFDLRHAIPPMRLNGESTLRHGLRFIGVGDAPQHLDDLLGLLEKGGIPEPLALSKGYTVETVLEVVRHLAQHVSSSPPLRRNPRREVCVNLCVANGFSRLHELAAAHTASISAAGERWLTKDISANGFLCILPSERANRMKIGELVGLQPEKIDRWGAGIVRRMSRDAQNNLLVGVEMLSNQLVGVLLHEHLNAASDIGGQRALYLNKPGDDSGEAWLLMKPEFFSAKRSLSMSMDEQQYLLTPLELMQQGEDYTVARYRKMEQAASSNSA